MGLGSRPPAGVLLAARDQAAGRGENGYESGGGQTVDATGDIVVPSMTQAAGSSRRRRATLAAGPRPGMTMTSALVDMETGLESAAPQRRMASTIAQQKKRKRPLIAGLGGGKPSTPVGAREIGLVACGIKAATWGIVTGKSAGHGQLRRNCPVVDGPVPPGMGFGYNLRVEDRRAEPVPKGAERHWSQV